MTEHDEIQKQFNQECLTFSNAIKELISHSENMQMIHAKLRNTDTRSDKLVAEAILEYEATAKIYNKITASSSTLSRLLYVMKNDILDQLGGGKPL